MSAAEHRICAKHIAELWGELAEKDKRIAELEVRDKQWKTKWEAESDNHGRALDRIAELEAKDREAMAVLRLLRHHRLTMEDGLPAGLLSRELTLIGYVSGDDARAFIEGQEDD